MKEHMLGSIISRSERIFFVSHVTPRYNPPTHISELKRVNAGGWVMVRSWSMAAVVVLFAMATGAATSNAATVYFLVSEFPDQREHGDSFVLPLSDDDD